MEITGRLEDWIKDAVYPVYWGAIHDDIRRRWNDGRWIHTSTVQEVYEKDGKTYVRTLNSLYELGNPAKTS